MTELKLNKRPVVPLPAPVRLSPRPAPTLTGWAPSAWRNKLRGGTR